MAVPNSWSFISNLVEGVWNKTPSAGTAKDEETTTIADDKAKFTCV